MADEKHLSTDTYLTYLEETPNFDIHNSDHLYKVWLEVNSYPREITLEDWHWYWAKPKHKLAVTIDSVLYTNILLYFVVFLVTNGKINLFPSNLLLIAVPLISAFVIYRGLPDVNPVGRTGVFSAISNGFGLLQIHRRIQPPPKHKVNLETLDVLSRAAAILVAPTINNLDNALTELSFQEKQVAEEIQPLEQLHRDILEEIERSDSDWQELLTPKVHKVESLLNASRERQQQIAQLRMLLEEKRANITKCAETLQSRKEILDRLKFIESDSEPTPATLDFSQSLTALTQSIEEVKVGLSEAQNIATAHEQAKAEITQLLDH